MTVSEPGTLAEAIHRFYRRWDSLERGLGADAGCVLDFDFCPAETDLPPFPTRWEALAELSRLQELAAAAPAGTFQDADYVKVKLGGASAYLRALMGERRPFADYVRDTMGFLPERVPDEQVRERRDAVETALGQHGLRLRPADSSAFRTALGLFDLTDFEPRLREQARLWIARLESRLGPGLEPEFRLEVVSEDAYWSNWIDGSASGGIRLRVNTHPRIEYWQGAHTALAAHEIAGHGAHVLQVVRSVARGALDSAALAFAVHSCEAFHMEGLAQALIELLAEPGELPPEVTLRQALGHYQLAVLNNAHMDLEEGRPVAEVLAQVFAQAPFLSRLSVMSGLRDRMRSPLHRSYIFVYGPALEMFLEARHVPWPERADLLRWMYSGLYTPARIRERIAAARGVSPAAAG